MKFCTQPFFNAENPEITSNFIIANLLDSNFLYFPNFVPSSKLNPKIKSDFIFEFYISKSLTDKKINKKYIHCISNEQKRFYLLQHFYYVLLCFQVKMKFTDLLNKYFIFFKKNKSMRFSNVCEYICL